MNEAMGPLHVVVLSPVQRRAAHQALYIVDAVGIVIVVIESFRDLAPSSPISVDDDDDNALDTNSTKVKERINNRNPTNTT